MTEELPYWPWKVYAYKEKHRGLEMQEFIVHARSRAAAKQLAMGKFDFEPDGVDAYYYTRSGELEREKMMNDIREGLERGIALGFVAVIVVMLCTPLVWLYDSVIGIDDVRDSE